MMLIPFVQDRSKSCVDLDLIQLERKIKAGGVARITVTSNEVIILNSENKQCYRSYVSNESTREQILKDARELDAKGIPRVANVEEDTAERSPGIFPVAFVVLFAAHMMTILLSLALMPLYILLVLKNDGLDQTLRIVWVVLICMMGMFAMPVYWYLYVWRGKPSGANPSSPSP